MRIRSFMLALALALPAAAASAQHEAPAAEEAHGDAHGGEHGALDAGAILSHKDTIGAFVNFFLLIGIFSWAVKKKVTPYLVERRRLVVEGLEEASRLKAEAEAKHKEYTDRLAKLDTELAQIRADMVKAGEVERDRIVAEAEKKAASLRHETEFLIGQRMKELRETLTREAVEAAVATAGKVLADKTTAEDQTRLAETYLASISAAGKGAPSARGGAASSSASATKKERLA